MRILALDIGGKRTGIAVTDELQMIATGLAGIATDELIPYLKNYFSKEKVEQIVVGKPLTLQNEDAESMPIVIKIIAKIEKEFPSIPIELYDERFTSKLAMRSMKIAGASKQQMKSKKTVDMISATIILQNYLEWRN